MLNLNFLAIHMPGFEEMFVLAIFGVILFGKKLPEVGRNLGKGIVEFKRGLKSIEEEVDRESSMPAQNNTPALPPPNLLASIEKPEYKFDPVTGAPLQQPVIPPGSKFDPFTGKPLATE